LFKRDIKPQNVLVTKEGKVKIADFGLARIYGFSIALTSVVVTLWYRSPEVLLHSIYSSTVDMWSLGCIFAELFLKKPLFMGNSDVDQLFKIFDILGLPSEKDWPVNSVIPLSSFTNQKNSNRTEIGSYLSKIIPGMDESAIDLLQDLLDFNFENRITARDALKSSFISNEKQKETEVEATNSTDLPLSDSTNTNNSNQQPNILKRKRLQQQNNKNTFE
jgi:serine/threonine protein kinase